MQQLWCPWKIPVPLVIKLQINAQYYGGSLPMFIVEINTKSQLEDSEKKDVSLEDPELTPG